MPRRLLRKPVLLFAFIASCQQPASWAVGPSSPAGPATLGSPSAASLASVKYAQGRILARSPNHEKLLFVQAGLALPADYTLTTTAQAAVELQPARGGLWRLGQRTAFLPTAEGGQLLTGHALAVVPSKQNWIVSSRQCRLQLSVGTWLLEAVENEGLKIICLDGPALLTALPADTVAENAPAANLNPPPPAPAHSSLKLRPGELVFLRPDTAAFSPPLTVFLAELLSTSRLLQNFPQPLPGQRRLFNLAQAQQERLQGVTNALVGGARTAEGFQLSVPTEPKSAAPSPASPSSSAPTSSQRATP